MNCATYSKWYYLGSVADSVVYRDDEFRPLVRCSRMLFSLVDILHKYAIIGALRYEEIKEWKDTDIKRLTGMKHETFNKMVAVLEREL